MENTEKAAVLGLIWKSSFKVFKENPVIFVPFCISGLLKLFFLAVIFFSIFFPLSIIFGPIINRLWGDIYLHYPFNFMLMPRLFYYAQIALYIFIDGLLSGIAVWMVYEANEGKKPIFSEAIKKVLPRYFTLAGFLFVIFLMVHFLSYGEDVLLSKLLKISFVPLLAKRGILDFIKLIFNFIVIVLIETGFAFAIPFAVLEGRGFFNAIGGSLCLLKRFFSKAFILIFVPTLFSLPFSLMKIGLPVLMDKTLPEITLVVLGLSVIVIVFVDTIVTTSLTYLFFAKKGFGNWESQIAL